jgi:hypothetical protein
MPKSKTKKITPKIQIKSKPQRSTKSFTNRSRVPLAQGSAYVNRDTDRVRVHRTIPIGVVTGTTDFTVQRIILNPGNPDFGWLSEFSKLFETYKFVGLRLKYVPDVPATTAGYLDLAVDWDITDPDPNSRIQLLSFRGASTGQVYVERTIDVMSLAANQMPQKYVSTNNNAEKRNTNVGVIMYNCNVTSEVGNLFLEVDLELFTPQITITQNVELDGDVIKQGAANRYAVLPQELLGAKLGVNMDLGNGVFARLPDANDVAAGFYDIMPIYTTYNNTAYAVTIASTDGAAGANQNIQAVTVGSAYTGTELFDNVLGTLSRIALYGLSKLTGSGAHAGYQPFVADATAAVLDIVIKFVKEANIWSADELAKIDRIHTTF